jgi:hypothetical protein
VNGPPLRNARLLEVSGPGSSEDGDHQATAGPAKWAGNVPVAISERKFTEVSNGKLSEIVQTEMALPAALAIDLQREDLVTYKLRRAQPATRRVRDIETPERIGLVRVTFWEA